eukprot:EG_transcript_24879
MRPAVLSGAALLEHMAAELGPALQRWRSRFDAGELAACDFVGAFILAWTAIRLRPTRRWASGPLRPPVVCTPNSLRTATQEPGGLEEAHVGLQSCSVQEVPGLGELLAYQDVDHHLQPYTLMNCPVAELFNRLRIVQLQEFVHTSLVHWAMGRRPYRLLFHVPAPVEVLRMQAEGQRVITLLMEPDQLRRKHVSHLLYMRVAGEGGAGEPAAPQHDRDALDFLLHDVKHMENFGGDAVTYTEQVGFCRALLRLGQ